MIKVSSYCKSHEKEDKRLKKRIKDHEKEEIDHEKEDKMYKFGIKEDKMS
jgi:hypothetical protein